MRFHVVGLPHTNTTAEFSSCAFTNKVIYFCKMMRDRGHEVYLYATDYNEASVTEHIPCLTEYFRKRLVGDRHYTEANWDPNQKPWRYFLNAVIAEIDERIQPLDVICVIGGASMSSIADAFPMNPTVEFGVGYGGVFSKYRVYESHAWRHMHMGAQGHITQVDGNFADAVIPGYLDPALFPQGTGSGDYFLYIGRLIDRKGYQIAVDVCKHLNVPLVMAGPGKPPAGVEYVGVVGPEDRAKLMGKAKAVFVPTLYIEPFGNVNIEAQACGTPVITTDWGAFTETVIQGVTGWRCNSLNEFVQAAKNVDQFDRDLIRRTALSRYSLDVVGLQYEQYFIRLLTMLTKGWDYIHAQTDT